MTGVKRYMRVVWSKDESSIIHKVGRMREDARGKCESSSLVVVVVMLKRLWWTLLDFNQEKNITYLAFFSQTSKIFTAVHLRYFQKH